MIPISGCGAPKFWMSKVFTLMGEKFAYYPVQMIFVCKSCLLNQVLKSLNVDDQIMLSPSGLWSIEKEKTGDNSTMLLCRCFLAK